MPIHRLCLQECPIVTPDYSCFLRSTHNTVKDFSVENFQGITGDQMDPHANVYGDHSVYSNEGAARMFAYTEGTQNANSHDWTGNQPIHFQAGEQLASAMPQQHFATPFPQLPPAANLNRPNYPQQPLHQYGMTDLDVHRTCRENQARDRATIARLEYNMEILHNYIRLRDEEHEREIQQLNEDIDRLNGQRQRQQSRQSDGLLAPLQPSTPRLTPSGGRRAPNAALERLPPPTYPVSRPPPPTIDLDVDETDTPDTSDPPPASKRVKRSHTTITWLDPPVSDALKRATGWLPEISTAIEPRRPVSAPATTEATESTEIVETIETEDDAEADFLAHWDAAE
ncbi:hypothetical protein LTR10_011631 [Elasticomyces elasticus]|uniref:BZIP domain-containing protein n=1 Tax=Exophiala sideris TaxID=1016849 RepID=A0ABR0JD22_9EURO|nr:hypothetical protein LTR10_011631 [Elasticomyces elasticus]KAK5031911.1 hypothetical protein LTS07_004532 [Exophiala sideris]KAK5040840.1 hypothetical protein LTR13_003141 [Exophiala sideris]KAK5061825.1 hypothetical protein LTR69_005009 [Exophiala sideris]KAK5184525.1 hypothetical protein LTR44_003200 [Eurotiomycetes sp. CCFEE 6388]